MIGAAVTALAGVGFVVATGAGSAGGCGERIGLTVAAAPDIAAPLEAVAERFDSRDVEVDGACVDVTVTAESSAGMADVLSGVTEGEQPDVWIPDSTMWVDRAQALEARTLSVGPSIASTPMVTAMPADTAAELGWADREVGWAEVLSPQQPARIADPTQETTGLGALTLARDVVGGGRITGSVVGVMRAAAEDHTDQAGQLFDQVRTAESDRPFVTTEQAVWAYNASGPTEPLEAVYPEEGSLFQDYPYVTVKPGADGDERVMAAAQRFLEAIQAPESQGLLQGAGFRTAAGTVGPALTTEHIDGGDHARLETPGLQEVEQVLRTWETVNLDAKMIAVMDVSGSMAAQTRGTSTRMDEARAAAQMAVTLFEDTSEVGLWSFSTKLDGDRDYKELVPVQPLDGNQRGALAQALDGLEPKRGGGTGLYDTVLAAFRAANAAYDPEKVNSVVLLTDGKSDDPDSIGLEELLATLRKEFDPEEPVPVITVAFGPDTDLEELRKISEATSGKLYVAEKPEDIGNVFLDAIAQRTCRPACS